MRRGEREKREKQESRRAGSPKGTKEREGRSKERKIVGGRDEICEGCEEAGWRTAGRTGVRKPSQRGGEVTTGGGFKG